MIDFKDLAVRWEKTVALMERFDLDVIVAIDSSRDEILLGHQRWLTGFTPMGLAAGAMIFRDGHVELLSPFLALTAPAFYGASGLPIEMVPGFSPALFAERVARAGARRVGYAEALAFPSVIADAIRATPASPELVDVSADMVKLRAVKSPFELEAIRESCAISDRVWGQMADIAKMGRKFYEIIADIDHVVRSQGGEGGFYLVSSLPVRGFSMDVVADPEEIEPGKRYLVEVSPRYQGYYSQLTSPVTTVADDAEAGGAYAAVVDAKVFAQPLMRPEADLTEIAGRVDDFIKSRGHAMSSRSLGHFCGIGLEEPRHDPSRPFILEAGMTMIFHPVLASPTLNSMMRADTYLITDAGAERLNKFSGGILTVS